MDCTQRLCTHAFYQARTKQTTRQSTGKGSRVRPLAANQPRTSGPATGGSRRPEMPPKKATKIRVEDAAAAKETAAKEGKEKGRTKATRKSPKTPVAAVDDSRASKEGSSEEIRPEVSRPAPAARPHAWKTRAKAPAAKKRAATPPDRVEVTRKEAGARPTTSGKSLARAKAVFEASQAAADDKSGSYSQGSPSPTAKESENSEYYSSDKEPEEEEVVAVRPPTLSLKGAREESDDEDAPPKKKARLGTGLKTKHIVQEMWAFAMVSTLACVFFGCLCVTFCRTF